MARVNVTQVKDIISTSLSDASIKACITAANILVDEKISGLGEDQLKEIERWLAAHFVAVQDPKVVSEKIGSASATYEATKLGEMLRATSYGQQAILLDTTGTLEGLGKKPSTMNTFGELD
jgi:hypothetical protein